MNEVCDKPKTKEITAGLAVGNPVTQQGVRL